MFHLCRKFLIKLKPDAAMSVWNVWYSLSHKEKLLSKVLPDDWRLEESLSGLQGGDLCLVLSWRSNPSLWSLTGHGHGISISLPPLLLLGSIFPSILSQIIEYYNIVNCQVWSREWEPGAPRVSPLLHPSFS